MRIVLDLQSLQTELRQFGVGRYSLQLARALVGQGKGHEFLIALNHAFPDTVQAVREAFADLLPPENIVSFRIPTPVAALDPNNCWRYQVAELIREHFLQQLRPDFVHVSSLLAEGLTDNAVTSIGRFADLPTAVTHYDLIPYLYPERYLVNPATRSWYMRKLADIRNAELLLAISEHSRREAIEMLALPEDRVVTISADADRQFQVLGLDQEVVQSLRLRYGLSRDFVMYTSGVINGRKNIEVLIEAYACLPMKIRAEHQLVIVCKIDANERRHVSELSSGFGLGKDEVILTGYISDEELVGLYNLCKLFVYPSLHEGFGLPVLEAMRCGAPVIGSNLSSIPEIICLEDSLFDPTSTHSICEKIYQALTDDQFRKRLREHALVRAGKFSWDTCAKRALEAMEASYERMQSIRGKARVSSDEHRPRLAYVSPLLPQKSAIAVYAGELLPELSRYYEIDVITNLDETIDPLLASNFRRRTVAEFQRYAHEYARVLYHLGNSKLYKDMFPLLYKYPGTVVLYDFFLGDILHHLEVTTPGSAIFRQALYRSHGYSAIWYWRSKGPEDAMRTYPCCLEVLRNAQGVIVHSDEALSLADKFFSLKAPEHLVRIPYLFHLPKQSNRTASRKALGLSESAFVVCSFGSLGATKLNDHILSSWLGSTLADDENCYLVFVGDVQGNTYEQLVRQRVEASGMENRIRSTGHVTPDVYEHYLAAADVAVQLETYGRWGASRTVLDCLAYGLPTVVNGHGSIDELPEAIVVKLPDGFTDIELAKTLEQLYWDCERREALGGAARDYVRSYLNPKRIARQYAEAIESFHQSHPVAVRRHLLSSIAMLSTRPKPTDVDLALVAEAINENTPSSGNRQLLVDISELAHRDAKTGIQRVVRSILLQLVAHPPTGYRIEPVYRSGGSYRYARRFMDGFLSIEGLGLADATVDVARDDIFLGLDLDLCIDEAARGWLRYHARRGLKVYFVVYDLIPLHKPDGFPPELHPMFMAWLENIASMSDGLVCISRTLATELAQWLDQHPIARMHPLHIGYFHLGADIEASLPTSGISATETAPLAQLAGRTSFLMVGTIEPRKGHAQALDAFELIWATGQDISLVMVGKQGWMVEDLVQRIRSHPEFNRRLVWFEHASDEVLLKLYRNLSALLIAATGGESFGLPLVEAAKNGMPIICRDSPAYHEVAGEHAFYFNGADGGTLANALKTWLDLYRMGGHRRSEGMRLLTWEGSAQMLNEVLFKSRWMASWQPGGGFCWHEHGDPTKCGDSSVRSESTTNVYATHYESN